MIKQYRWLATHYPETDLFTQMDSFALTASCSLLTSFCNESPLENINIEQMLFLLRNMHLVQKPIPRLQLLRAINTAQQQLAAGKTVFLMPEL